MPGLAGLRAGSTHTFTEEGSVNHQLLPRPAPWREVPLCLLNEC